MNIKKFYCRPQRNPKKESFICCQNAGKIDEKGIKCIPSYKHKEA